MGSGFSKMKKQARMMQQQASEMQEQLKTVELEGSAGGGLVKVVMRGDKTLKSVKISKDCVDPDDIEGLEDLVFGAFEDALKKTENQDPMSGLPGNLPF